MERYPTRHILDDLQRKLVFVGGPRQVGKANNPLFQSYLTEKDLTINPFVI